MAGHIKMENIRLKKGAIYEGLRPAGIAIMVEAVTNNRNRTAAEIRLIFSKNAGTFGESGIHT